MILILITVSDGLLFSYVERSVVKKFGSILPLPPYG